MLEQSFALVHEELDLLQAVIDSMPAPLAVLESDGTIQLRNQAWAESVAANDDYFPAYGIGDSFFDSCRSSAGVTELDVCQMSDGLRDVIDGHQSVWPAPGSWSGCYESWDTGSVC